MQKIGQRLLWVVIIAITQAGTCRVASATDGPGQPGPANQGQDRTVSVGRDGVSGGVASGASGRTGTRRSSGNGGSAPVCYSTRSLGYDVTVGPLQFEPAGHSNLMSAPLPDDHHAFEITHCVFPDGHRTNKVAVVDTTPTPGGAPVPVARLTPAALALRATAGLHFEFPGLRASPPNGRLVVGFPTWVWVDRSSWSPIVVTDVDADLSVTLTATPSTVLFDPGDGTSVVDCRGPGTPFVGGSMSAWNASPTCGHTYTTPSSRHVGGKTDTTTTVVWSFAWTASDGTSGTLPDMELSHHEPFTVSAYTAVTN